MNKFEFSYQNYQNLLGQNLLVPPQNFVPYNNVNKKKYLDLKDKFKKNNHDIKKAFQELKKRTSKDYFFRIYTHQSRTLGFANSAFHAYNLIIPEIIAEDWLAIVDWHSYKRDHALHQPLCSYIILELLNSNHGLEIGRKKLIDHCLYQLQKSHETSYLKEYLNILGIQNYSSASVWLEMKNMNIWKALFTECANLAALFHDMGYPWQYINSLNSNVSHVDVFENELANEYENVLKKFSNRMFLYPFTYYDTKINTWPNVWSEDIKKLMIKALSTTHGLPGAIGFMSFYDLICDYHSVHPTSQLCVEWAAMAIMMHDFCKLYWDDKTSTLPKNGRFRISFHQDPLSFVITLTDLIQEFSRPDTIFTPNPMDAKVEYRSKCEQTDVFVDDNNVLNIVYKYKNLSDVIEKNSYLKNADDNRRYFDPKCGFLDYSALGINNIQMKAELM